MPEWPGSLAWPHSCPLSMPQHSRKGCVTPRLCQNLYMQQTAQQKLPNGHPRSTRAPSFSQNQLTSRLHRRGEYKPHVHEAGLVHVERSPQSSRPSPGNRLVCSNDIDDSSASVSVKAGRSPPTRGLSPVLSLGSVTGKPSRGQRSLTLCHRASHSPSWRHCVVTGGRASRDRKGLWETTSTNVTLCYGVFILLIVNLFLCLLS